MCEIFVNIMGVETNYPIFIKNEPISDLKEKILEKIDGENYLVVISEKVESLYGKDLDFPKQNKFILKDGEKEKNFNNYQKIINRALELKLTRKSSIIAIGGGVCGDLAGFAASTYMRGINFIQVPTTLLACVDSSVGGKTAIDTNFGKNLVGTFYQPKYVFINPEFLKTLDERQFKSGLGEVVKYAFIEKSCKADDDYNLMNFLTEKHSEIMCRDEKTLSKIIEICINLKKSVVEKDEKESDLRRILNFGHTYGHAVEKMSNYQHYTHGEAVVEGMRFAFHLALTANLIDKNYVFFVEDMFKIFNFPHIPKDENAKMIALMKSDKKAEKDCINFVLPTDYATVEVVEIVDCKL